jgi:hypothetical protein
MRNNCRVNIDVDPYFMCEGYNSECDHFCLEKRMTGLNSHALEYDDCIFRVRPYLCTNQKARSHAYSVFIGKIINVNNAQMEYLNETD